MEDSVRPEVVGVGAADDADDGEVLAIGTRDGVEHAEASHGEGDDTSADAARAGVAIGGVPGVKLVTASDEAEAGLGDEVVEEGEVEVPGDGEHVVGAHLDESPSQVASKGLLRRRSLNRGSDGVAVPRRRAADDAVRFRFQRRIHRPNLGFHCYRDRERVGEPKRSLFPTMLYFFFDVSYVLQFPPLHLLRCSTKDFYQLQTIAKDLNHKYASRSLAYFMESFRLGKGKGKDELRNLSTQPDLIVHPVRTDSSQVSRTSKSVNSESDLMMGREDTCSCVCMQSMSRKKEIMISKTNIAR
ncbi:hypothetical protein B296_00028393 [Ensete ventricosum]|uniref:Uncharacterized protein n=1 Tax=Ensete ventricosum TaxID=4639 RepID=A0A426Y7W3_ENSVE|nr:hypothetical protein B296_00028393 [Ensete ventricosum]